MVKTSSKSAPTLTTVEILSQVTPSVKSPQQHQSFFIMRVYFVYLEKFYEECYKGKEHVLHTWGKLCLSTHPAVLS